jgi:hypothetical protein
MGQVANYFAAGCGPPTALRLFPKGLFRLARPHITHGS